MDWSSIKNTIASAAPMIGGLLGPAGGLVGTMVASALGVEDTPDAVSKALSELETKARSDENILPTVIEAVESLATLGEISDRLREIYGEHKG